MRQRYDIARGLDIYIRAITTDVLKSDKSLTYLTITIFDTNQLKNNLYSYNIKYNLNLNP